MSQSVDSIQRQKSTLRSQMRQLRRKLTPHQQNIAAKRLYKNLCTSRYFRFSKRIAFTLARDGEINPLLLMKTAHARGKACYLPVMNSFGEPRLSFRRWLPGQKLTKGAYNIPEPLLGAVCPAKLLNLVLFPLVAFDNAGNRLGMGKGYYDRSFAFLRHSSRQSPVLLGLAHECQRVERLQVASWDVPLRGIVTDLRWYQSA